MTTVQLILLDHVVALLGVVSWFATGVTAALRRYRLAFGLLIGAGLVTIARLATVGALSGRGWWFVQEKVLLGLPLLVTAALAAVLIAGPRLNPAGRPPGASPPVGAHVPTGGLVALFTSGYAALAGLVVTFLAGYPLSWSTALIAVSVVCAAALLTARVVGRPADEPADADPPARAPLPGASSPDNVSSSAGASSPDNVSSSAGSSSPAGASSSAGSSSPAEVSSPDRASSPDGTVSPDSESSLAGASSAHAPAPVGVAARDSLPAPAAARRPPLSRRRFLTLAGGVVAAGAGATGVGLLFRAPEDLVTGGGPGPITGSGATVSVADLRGARASAPGGTTQRHTLTAKNATVRLASGREVAALTYSGELPGPAITATEGDLIEVTLRNTDIEDGVTVHWHGYDVPCGEDGAPGATQDAVAPGGEFVYRFRADQVGTYWYHTHQASHVAVRKGLYGTLVVKPRGAQRVDESQLDLTLPVHTFDGTVVIGNQEGRAVHTARPGAPVRLRLINTDSDPHRFAVAGAAFRVVAVDGRDLHQPGDVREFELRLPAGGRYDVLLTMPETPVALMLDKNPGRGIVIRPTGHAGADPALPDTSDWPELDLLHYGEPTAVPFDAGNADRHFTMVLDRAVAMVDGRPTYAQSIDGRGHPSVPDQLVTQGDVVHFTVVNRSLETHPWHLHGHPVLILSRDGVRSSGSPVWVDTFDVRPGEVWEVAFQAGNPGIWMNHCHNLPHQEQGMMLRLVYDGVSTPFADGSHAH